MSDHSEHDLLRELFPETAREWFGDHPTPRETLGLYAVADGRMALVSGAQLAEFTPLDPKGNKVLHCDLCHYTRSRSEAAVYRVLVSSRRTRYMTLCFGTEGCQGRAGKEGVRRFAERIFPIESLYAE